MMIRVKYKKDYLRHKEAEERKDHKYIKREKGKNGKWIYYYEKETDKLFDSEHTVNASNGQYVYTQKGKISQTFDTINTKVNELLNKPISNDTIEKGKSFVDKILKRDGGVKNKYEEKDSNNEVSNKEIIDRVNKKSKEKKKLTDESSIKEIINRLNNKSKEKKDSNSDYVQKELRRREQEEREKTEVLDDFSDLKLKHSNMSNDEEQAAINPYYYTKKVEYTTNCAYCTLAYDLRKRGYDIEAAMKDDVDGDTNFDTMCKLYENAEMVSLQDVFDKQDPERHQSWIEKTLHINDPYPIIDIRQKEAGAENTAKYLTQELESYGDGARGMLGVAWSTGGAHAMVWEVENGKVIIRDCQSNKTYDVETIIERSSNLNYMRMDNVEPNTDILKFVRNKG